MTIIAWDGKTLAADKASTSVGYARTVTKIFRVPEGLVGFAGCAEHAMQLLEWFMASRPSGEFPKRAKDEECAGALFIGNDGVCWGYGATPYPERVEERFDAIGCGRDYALAAMHLGHDARHAVEVACALDVNCGKGIDTLSLNEACEEKHDI